MTTLLELINEAQLDEKIKVNLIQEFEKISNLNPRDELAPLILEHYLYHAAFEGLLAATKFLILHDANVEGPLLKSSTPLLQATLGGHYPIIQFLLENKANPEVRNSDGETPLHLAIQIDIEKIVQLLLEYEAHIETPDEDGSTPLHLACQLGNEKIIQLLLEYGADIEARNEDGYKPLHIATYYGHKGIVRLLLDNKANVVGSKLFIYEKQTPLHEAASQGYKQIARLLIEHEADIEDIDAFGKTPILLAAENSHLDVVQLLIDNGANIKAANSLGYTALDYAVLCVNLKICRLLLLNGAEIEAANSKSYTPVYFAALEGANEILKLFLDYHANIDMTNNDGNTPLHAAINFARITDSDVPNFEPDPEYRSKIKLKKTTVEILLTYGSKPANMYIKNKKGMSMVEHVNKPVGCPKEIRDILKLHLLLNKYFSLIPNPWYRNTKDENKPPTFYKLSADMLLKILLKCLQQDLHISGINIDDEKAEDLICKMANKLKRGIFNEMKQIMAEQIVQSNGHL